MLETRARALALVEVGPRAEVVAAALSAQVVRGVPDHRCWFCARLTFKYNLAPGDSVPANQRTREHLTPPGRGGAGAANIVRACHACNNRKGNRTLDEYRVHVGATSRDQRAAMGMSEQGLFWGELFARGMAAERRGLRSPSAANPAEVHSLILRTVRKWRLTHARWNAAVGHADAAVVRRLRDRAHRLVWLRLMRLDCILDTGTGGLADAAESS